MALYDRFSDVMKAHGPFVQCMERKRQERILDWMAPFLKIEGGACRALEVGIGIGLFASACRQRGWRYIGIDRNEKMVQALDEDYHVLVGEVPPLPEGVDLASCDLAYSSFVLEHLADGIQCYEFVRELSRALKPEGVLVLVVPDALNIGIEFWNLDYTHRYPTADRNVTQILLECGLQVERLIRYRGAGWTGWQYLLARVAGWFYSYRFWQIILCNRNWPYSVYYYLKNDILVFICRKPVSTGEVSC